jgi:MacB-like periplasmic core domain
MSELVDDAGASRRLIYALQEGLRSAMGSILAHRLRSFLTMLGIIIGVASVICVIALVQGLSSSITEQFTGLGSTTLTLQAETPIADRLRGKVNRLRLSDVDELRFRMDGISYITPIVPVAVGQASYGDRTASGQFMGTTQSLQDVQQLFARTGRFITNSDDDSRRRVVVLGPQGPGAAGEAGRHVHPDRSRVVQGGRRDGIARHGVRPEPRPVPADAVPDSAVLRHCPGESGFFHHLCRQ